MYVCICNWPLPIGAFQDQCKQIIVINKHNLVKNPNWREADQLVIYKRRREAELGANENNMSQRSEHKSGALTTRLRCFLKIHVLDVQLPLPFSALFDDAAKTEDLLLASWPFSNTCLFLSEELDQCFRDDELG